MADPVGEIRLGPVNSPDDRRIALELLERKLNEIIRALNELLTAEES